MNSVKAVIRSSYQVQMKAFVKQSKKFAWRCLNRVETLDFALSFKHRPEAKCAKIEI